MAGANLFLVYNRTQPTATLKERCLSLGASGVTFVQCNVGEIESCEKLVQTVLDAAGRVDVLVNNAGANGLESVRDGLAAAALYYLVVRERNRKSPGGAGMQYSVGLTKLLGSSTRKTRATSCTTWRLTSTGPTC